MTLKEFALLFFSTIVSVFGQIFLKIGANKLGQVTASNAVSLILNIVLTPELMLGLFCYGLGAIAYILLLTRVDLSIVGPASALVYIFSVLVGKFYFGDIIPIYRYFGLGFIVCGVILVVWQHK